MRPGQSGWEQLLPMYLYTILLSVGEHVHAWGMLQLFQGPLYSNSWTSSDSWTTGWMTLNQTTFTVPFSHFASWFYAAVCPCIIVALVGRSVINYAQVTSIHLTQLVFTLSTVQLTYNEAPQERPAETRTKDGQNGEKRRVIEKEKKKKKNRWDTWGEAVQRPFAIRELEEESKQKGPEWQIICTESQVEKAFEHLK